MELNVIEKIPKLTLGEGLFWDWEYKKLWFVDIKSFMLYVLDIYTNELKYWKFKEEVCWVVPTYSKYEVIIGLKSGVAKFNIQEAKLKWLIKNFPKNDKIRLNDVGVDEKERLWFGSMHNEDESLEVGELVSFSKKEGLIFHDKNYNVTNGPIIWENYLFHNDSFKGIIYRYEISEGRVKNKRIFKKFTNDGKPDGMCFDEEGNILVAMWGSGKINRINQKGDIIQTFKLPAPLVTNVCFGGENLDRLFVTSASVGMNEKELKKYPKSRSLFEIKNINFKRKKQKR